MRYLIAAAALGLTVSTSVRASEPAVSSASQPSIEAKAKIAFGGLYEIVHNPKDGLLYVAATGPRGSQEARVLVLDPATLEIERDIAVNAAPFYGLGLDTKAQLLYGTSTRAGFVGVVGLSSGEIANFKLEGSEAAHLREIVADEATGKAYASVVVGGEEGAVPPQQIWVIDGRARKVERAIEVDTEILTGLALDAPNGRLFATGMGKNEVLAIDIASGEVTARYPSGGASPVNLVYDAAGQRLFVANQESGNLTVLDAATGEQKAAIATGVGALGVNYDPARQRIYVANRQAGTLSVIDASNYAVLADLAIGTYPQTIALDRASGKVYVTNKARGLPRNAPADAPPLEDPNGDTVVTIGP